jgi:uncharacterized protein YbjT (DUF2867 family)
MRTDPVLVIGATGYVGGRLVPLLLESGYHVRAMGRSLKKLGCQPWAGHPELELVEGNTLDPESLKKACSGCRAAFYLVHSMISQKSEFIQADRKSARNMVEAAASQGLEQIVYLGGLGDVTDPKISKHLRSRNEVGEILRAGPVPATTLRAAMILGSGSASFEILRYLVERLPVMIVPRWLLSLSQPIAISNVLGYLVGCLECSQTLGKTFDIGGEDILTYLELMDIYAEEAGIRKRLIFKVPVLTPTLSAYWIHLVSPVPAAIAIPLAEGLTSEAVCRENRIRALIPQRLLSCREAICLALDRIRQQQVESCWKDSGKLLPPEWAYCGDADYAGGTVMELPYELFIQGSPQDAWDVISRIGGNTQWYCATNFWKLRGILDKLIGGTGYRKGRKHPSKPMIGEALDFCRVLNSKEPERLSLLIEMKSPGDMLMDLECRQTVVGRTRILMNIRFMPRGISGLLFWHAMVPLHKWISRRMLKSIGGATGKKLLKGPVPAQIHKEQSCALPATPN